MTDNQDAKAEEAQDRADDLPRFPIGFTDDSGNIGLDNGKVLNREDLNKEAAAQSDFKFQPEDSKPVAKDPFLAGYDKARKHFFWLACLVLICGIVIGYFLAFNDLKECSMALKKAYDMLSLMRQTPMGFGAMI